MNCPVCPGATLVMSERSGVEIDYCPTCRGVWLDRGELDKILERVAAEVRPPAMAAAPAAPAATATLPPPGPVVHHHHYDDDDDDHRRYPPAYRGEPYGAPHKKKRKSFLEELFD